MNFLDKIIATKQEEITRNRQHKPIAMLEKSKFFEGKCRSLAQSLQKSHTGIIAEFKRKSPSKGIINDQVTVEEVVCGYETAGASGISVITDIKHFTAQDEDLPTARHSISIPILCKDFIIDEYQLIAAKAMGADVILLIAEVLSKKTVKIFATQAKVLGLEVLMELHSEEELDKITDDLDLIGVNNRDLKTFSVDIERSVRLFPWIPNNFIKISESGISKPENIVYLREVGFQGFLIGENFMRSSDPGESCKRFIRQLKEIISL
ncbi:MAG: indole-3-glycerol phosphate synthase TrpC [Flavobacteriales bacterium AspAUS03]